MPPWVKGKLLANTGLWSIAAVAWFFASTAWSAWTGNWEWFQRSGSIRTLAGLMLAGRSIMRQGRAGVGTKPSATIATLAAAEHLLSKTGLRLDPNMKSLFEMRRDGTNHLTSRRLVLSLSTEAQKNLEVVGRINIPLFAKVATTYKRAIHERYCYKLTIEVRF